MSSDAKRQNVGARVAVALPKAEAAQPGIQLVSPDASLQQIIGSRIKVTLSSSAHPTLEGVVYTADPLTNLLVLFISTSSTSITSSSLAAPSGTYRIIPISQIASFQILSLPQPPTEVASSAPITVDTNAVQARLAKNIAAKQAAQARLGPKGTTPTDQALFDALSRTLSASWSGSAMFISDTYLIDKPYEAANVKIIDGRPGDLDRMKKVVEMERQKVKLKLSKNLLDGKLGSEKSLPKGATTAQIKKGG